MLPYDHQYYHQPPAEKCGRDSLSSISSFLSLREYQFILTISQEWHRTAQLKTSWPQFDASAYIRQLLASPQVNPPHRSLLQVNDNISRLGHSHLIASANEEYRTKKQEYHQLYGKSPLDVQASQLYIDTTVDETRDIMIEQLAKWRWLVNTEIKAGSDVLTSRLEKSRIYSCAGLIELKGCNTESFSRIISCFPSLRAIRLKNHTLDGRPSENSLSQQICEQVEVLETDVLSQESRSKTKAGQEERKRAIDALTQTRRNDMRQTDVTRRYIKRT